MQPEQNNDSATVIDTPEVSMEHSGPTENIMAQDNSSSKKKNGKTGIILGFILLFLLAAGGVGFGIWAMIDGNAQREKLESQIATLREQNSALSDIKKELESELDSGLKNETQEKPGDEVILEDNYLIIKEWGLKAELPKNIKINTYDYSENGYCGPGVMFKSAEIDGEQFVWDDAVGYITRCTLEKMHPYATFVYSDGSYNYYYESPNGLADDEVLIEIIKELKDIFINKTIYSKE